MHIESSAWLQSEPFSLRWLSVLFLSIDSGGGVVVQSVLFSLVVPDSLQPDGLKHARLPCPSLSPRGCSNSGPFSQ